MVFFFNRVGKRLDALDQSLDVSFDRVRQDTENIYEWLRYLYDLAKSQHAQLAQKVELIDAHESQIAMQQRLIHELKQEVSIIPKSKEEMKALLDEVYSLQPLLERIRSIENRLLQMESRRPAIAVQQQSIEPVRQSVSALKERVLKRIAKNSKEYIKSVVRGVIGKYGRISALQLREMIVEEQGLCSKSSFYRILEELEQENAMLLASKGKEKVYVSTSK